ncbi:MAG: alkaline phosphatase [Brevinema sp.]
MKYPSILVCMLLMVSCSKQAFTTNSGSTELVKAKNTIILIADGQSVNVTTLLRWYKGGENLAVDSMASGLVRTHNADTPIADSAPAGTALATGHKSHTGFIGVLPDEAILPGATINGTPRRPVASILEASRLAGKSTGIIATSEIMHATPAAYSSHYPSRKAYDNLSEQQVYQNIDVIMGGGHIFFTPEGREDGKDLSQVFVDKGYRIARTKAEMDAVSSGKIWGAFADKDMAYHFDRSEEEPSLAEMTGKAIQLLSKNTKGFFLMVEGSKVDWAAHANDPAGLISDALAFDDAVKVALDFAKKDGNTIVIAVTDHGNSGISIGDSSTSVGYDYVKLETFIDPFKKVNLTAEGIARQIEQGTDIASAINTGFGIVASPADIASLRGKTGQDLHYGIGPILAREAKIGFTTRGHTGEDIPLYSYLPGDKRITGVLDNVDIPRYAAAAMGLDLDQVTQRLFVSVDDLQARGVIVSIENNQLTLKKNKTLVFEKNKNVAFRDGTPIELEGVVVDNGITWYVPAQVEKLLN